MVRVQRAPIDTSAEAASFATGDVAVGAVVIFVGRVRHDDRAPVTAIELEHYPGMTETKIGEIDAEARRRWSLIDTLVIHRYGRLLPGEPIVFVATAASHRKAAFESCEFLIDWLKTKAPFWKLEELPGGGEWVEARASDDTAASRWD